MNNFNFNLTGHAGTNNKKIFVNILIEEKPIAKPEYIISQKYNEL